MYRDDSAAAGDGHNSVRDYGGNAKPARSVMSVLEVCIDPVEEHYEITVEVFRFRTVGV